MKLAAKDSLTNHIWVVHDGIKPFECDVCNKSFGTIFALHRHNQKKNHDVKGILPKPKKQPNKIVKKVTKTKVKKTDPKKKDVKKAKKTAAKKELSMKKEVKKAEPTKK